MSDDKSAQTLIPPTPTAEDYFQAPERPLIPEVDDPIALFEAWLAEARKTEPNDSNAMSLATVGADGQPDVRIVLLKGVDALGLQFFTNFESAKADQLKANPKAALGFHWKTQRRQVRIRGGVQKVEDGVSDAYFASRAKPSRIGAVASRQSQPLEDRDAFKAEVEALTAKYDGVEDVPRPANWGGYRLVPDAIEFWQDQAFRMHDRLLFQRTGEGWSRMRLYP